MPRALRHTPLLGALLAACASTVDPAIPPDGAARDAPPPDAAAGDAGPDGAPQCPPREPPASAAACAGLAELATPANAVRGSPDTYALAALQPAQNALRPACLVEPWQDGFEARVRFTVPRGGRWRVTASGAELWALDLRRACGDSMACTGNADLHGAFASAEHTLDVQLERGESVAVVLDGCPAAGACRYGLRAQRVADLACEFANAGDRRCAATGQRCAVDPCDPERFRCEAAPAARDALSGPRVLVDEARRRTWFVTGVTVPAWTRRPLMARWLDASGRALGAVAYVGTLRPDGERFFAGDGALPPSGATRAVLWLYDDAPVDGHPGAEVTLERYLPPGEGAPCDDGAFVTRCAEGLRCEAVCQRPAAVAITEARAWRDDLADLLRVTIEGTGVGEHVQNFEVALLDAAGAERARLEGVGTVTTFEQPANITFRTAFELSNDPLHPRPSGVPAGFVLPRDVARVRLVARDARGNRSAPAEAAVAAVTVAPLGAPCDEPAVGCARGLACEEAPGASLRRCLPATTRSPCGLRRNQVVWGPVGDARSFTLEGVPHATGGVTRCYGGRSQGAVALEFVAPVTATWILAQRGLRAIEVRSACGGAAGDPVCSLSPDSATEAPVAVALTAGQRYPIVLLGDASGPAREPFTLTARIR